MHKRCRELLPPRHFAGKTSTLSYPGHTRSRFDATRGHLCMFSLAAECGMLITGWKSLSSLPEQQSTTFNRTGPGSFIGVSPFISGLHVPHRAITVPGL